MEHEFEPLADHSIRVGRSEVHIKHDYGLEPKKFLDFFQHLGQDYGLRLNKVEFPEFVMGDEKTKGIVRPIEHIVNFIIYCNVLEEMGLDIHNLIRQIQNCRHLKKVYHADSLAKLSFIYKTAGHDIVFSKSGADLIIDNIRAELKTRLPPVLRRPRRLKVTSAGSLDISSEILMSIINRISLRFLEGSKQAELLFFDMSEDMEYGFIDLYGPMRDKMPDEIPRPSLYRLIFYQTRFYPIIMRDKILRFGVPLPIRTFPNLHEFRGHWIDIDPSLWKTVPKTFPTPDELRGYWIDVDPSLSKILSRAEP